MYFLKNYRHPPPPPAPILENGSLDFVNTSYRYMAPSIYSSHFQLKKPNNGPTMVSVDFEVYGDVQGVYFTKYCKEMGQALELRGWVRNSRQGTVVGKIQGEKEKVDDMAMWLRIQGSPGSRIDHCAFRNWSIIDSFDFGGFRVLY